MGDGPREVFKVCRIVKGCRVAINMEPLRYLEADINKLRLGDSELDEPNGESLAVSGRSKRSNWAEKCPRSSML